MLKPYKGAKRSHITQGFYDKHKALDLSFNDDYGTPLIAPEDCIVLVLENAKKLATEIENEGLKNGWGVRLQSLDGKRQHLYWHCLPVFPVSELDRVKAGKIVAFMGNSGLVYSGGEYVPLQERNKPPYRGTHLHQEYLEKDDRGNWIKKEPPIDWDREVQLTFADRLLSIKVALQKILKLL